MLDNRSVTSKLYAYQFLIDDLPKRCTPSTMQHSQIASILRILTADFLQGDIDYDANKNKDFLRK